MDSPFLPRSRAEHESSNMMGSTRRAPAGTTQIITAKAAAMTTPLRPIV